MSSPFRDKDGNILTLNEYRKRMKKGSAVQLTENSALIHGLDAKNKFEEIADKVAKKILPGGKSIQKIEDKEQKKFESDVQEVERRAEEKRKKDKSNLGKALIKKGNNS